MSLSLEWFHDGRRLIVPVTVYRARPYGLTGIEGTALVDTGSTTTGIATRFAAKLSLPRRGKKPMSSVGGDLQVERYIFRIGITADADPDAPPKFPYVFDDVEGFAMHDGFQFDVLLGMDILAQCDLSIDRRRRARLTFG